MNNEKIKELLETKWKKQFSFEQWKQITFGLVDNLDVSIYAKNRFSHNQMREIRTGLEQGLDVSIYAKKIFTAEKMLNERLKLKESEIIVF